MEKLICGARLVPTQEEMRRERGEGWREASKRRELEERGTERGTEIGEMRRRGSERRVRVERSEDIGRGKDGCRYRER